MTRRNLFIGTLILLILGLMGATGYVLYTLNQPADITPPDFSVTVIEEGQPCNPITDTCEPGTICSPDSPYSDANYFCFGNPDASCPASECDRVIAYECTYLNGNGECLPGFDGYVGSQEWGSDFSGAVNSISCGQVDTVCRNIEKTCGNFIVIRNTCGNSDDDPPITTPKPEPSLAIDKYLMTLDSEGVYSLATNNSYRVGEDIYFRIRITNDGNTNFDSVRFRDIYDIDALEFQSGEIKYTRIDQTTGDRVQVPKVNFSDEYYSTTNELRINIPDLPSIFGYNKFRVGESYRITLHFKAKSKLGVTTNLARADDKGAITVEDTQDVEILEPIMNINKAVVVPSGDNYTPTDKEYKVGDTIYYRVRITNDGKLSFSSVGFNDKYNPQHLKFLSGTIRYVRYNKTSGALVNVPDVEILGSEVNQSTGTINIQNVVDRFPYNNLRAGESFRFVMLFEAIAPSNGNSQNTATATDNSSITVTDTEEVIITTTTNTVACGATCSATQLCPTNHTCSNGTCVLNACLPNLDACTGGCTLNSNVACSGDCVQDSQCTAANNVCSNGKCVLNTCATTPSSCNTDLCSVLPNTPVCNDTCSSNSDCPTDHTCSTSTNRCVHNTCVQNPDLCLDGVCNPLPENVACGSQCQVDAQCANAANHSCVGGICTLNTCADDPNSCIDSCTPNNPTCGDGIVNGDEECDYAAPNSDNCSTACTIVTAACVSLDENGPDPIRAGAGNVIEYTLVYNNAAVGNPYPNIKLNVGDIGNPLGRDANNTLESLVTAFASPSTTDSGTEKTYKFLWEARNVDNSDVPSGTYEVQVLLDGNASSVISDVVCTEDVTVSTTSAQVAVFTIVKNSSVVYIPNGDVQINYTLTVTNNSAIEGIIESVEDVIDSDLVAYSISPTNISPTYGTYNLGRITWIGTESARTFAAGESKTYSYRITIPYSNLSSFTRTGVDNAATVRFSEDVSTHRVNTLVIDNTPGTDTPVTNPPVVVPDTALFDDASHFIILASLLMITGLVVYKMNIGKLQVLSILDPEKGFQEKALDDLIKKDK